MVKVFGIFISFVPEIIAANSERDAVKRAIANGTISREEVRDADIRELTAAEILFWSDRTVSDRELMLDSLKRNHTPAGDLMREYLNMDIPLDDVFLNLFEEQSLENQRDCWQALSWALIGYKPSVQRDRLIKFAAQEALWVADELLHNHRNELQAYAEIVLEREGFNYAA